MHSFFNRGALNRYRGLWLGLGLAVLGGVAWWALVSWPEAPAPGAQARQGTDARSAAVLQALLQAPRPDSAPKPTGLTIQGTVLGPRGLVAGARVLATLAVEGETLSTLPELVEERRGEALTLAEAVTAEDGSFVLSGLEPGSYALWVESVEGAGFQDGVGAGSSSVVLRMGAGVRLSGTVTMPTAATSWGRCPVA
ncbi:MAG TPA: carboxypeptidase-like regulatory domain-containing protein [Myxococcaceae bacterium]|nr:carboxypeptidase-like regulatory domain-containing protein [Myxococcaceae bacterium]